MSARRAKGNPPEDVCFEEALGKLEMIVKELEKGELGLEESLNRFAEGVTFSQICLVKLRAAEETIDTIIRDENGTFVEYPLQLGEEK